MGSVLSIESSLSVFISLVGSEWSVGSCELIILLFVLVFDSGAADMNGPDSGRLFFK